MIYVYDEKRGSRHGWAKSWGRRAAGETRKKIGLADHVGFVLAHTGDLLNRT